MVGFFGFLWQVQRDWDKNFKLGCCFKMLCLFYIESRQPVLWVVCFILNQDSQFCEWWSRQPVLWVVCFILNQDSHWIKTASFVSGLFYIESRQPVLWSCAQNTHQVPCIACFTHCSLFGVAHERWVLGSPKEKPQRDCSRCPTTCPTNRCSWTHSPRGCSRCPNTCPPNRCSWAQSRRLQQVSTHLSNKRVFMGS